MTRQVTLEEVKSQLSALIEAAKNGETIVIADNDQPIVQITAVSSAKRRPQFGSAHGLLKITDDFDAPLLEFSEYIQ